MTPRLFKIAKQLRDLTYEETMMLAEVLAREQTRPDVYEHNGQRLIVGDGSAYYDYSMSKLVEPGTLPGEFTVSQQNRHEPEIWAKLINHVSKNIADRSKFYDEDRSSGEF